MRRYLARAADLLQRQIARSLFLVRLAVLVRNQCRCVIKYRLAESPDVNETGEVWLRKIAAPRCSAFVDVGANVGDWLAGIAAEKHGESFRAVAYEPSNSAFAQLRERFGGDDRIVLRNCAAGDAAGQVEFFEEFDAGKGSSIVANFLSTPGYKRTVGVVRLDDEIAELGCDRIDFLKVDAEGYDMRVLAGAKNLLQNQRIGIVQFEYNRGWQIAGNTLFAAMQFFNLHGYEVFVLKRDGLYTLDYELYEDYFEYSNFVALSPRFRYIRAEKFRGTI